MSRRCAMRGLWILLALVVLLPGANPPQGEDPKPAAKPPKDKIAQPAKYQPDYCKVEFVGRFHEWDSANEHCGLPYIAVDSTKFPDRISEIPLDLRDFQDWPDEKQFPRNVRNRYSKWPDVPKKKLRQLNGLRVRVTGTLEQVMIQRDSPSHPGASRDVYPLGVV